MKSDRIQKIQMALREVKNIPEQVREYAKKAHPLVYQLCLRACLKKAQIATGEGKGSFSVQRKSSVQTKKTAPSFGSKKVSSSGEPKVSSSVQRKKGTSSTQPKNVSSAVQSKNRRSPPTDSNNKQRRKDRFESDLLCLPLIVSSSISCHTKTPRYSSSQVESRSAKDLTIQALDQRQVIDNLGPEPFILDQTGASSCTSSSPIHDLLHDDTLGDLLDEEDRLCDDFLIDFGDEEDTYDIPVDEIMSYFPNGVTDAVDQ